MSSDDDLTRIPPTACSKCGYVMNMAYDATGGGRQAQPGDVSVCFMCMEVAELDDDMRLVPVDVDSLEPAVQLEIRYLRQRIIEVRSKSEDVN